MSVSYKELRDVLNAHGGNVGSRHSDFFSEKAKINKWSWYKPITCGKQFDATEDDYYNNDDGFTLDAVRCGVGYGYGELFDGIESEAFWAYKVPTEMRIGDYRGYDASKTVEDWRMRIAIDGKGYGGTPIEVNQKGKYHIHLNSAMGGVELLKKIKTLNEQRLDIGVIVTDGVYDDENPLENWWWWKCCEIHAYSDGLDMLIDQSVFDAGKEYRLMVGLMVSEGELTDGSWQQFVIDSDAREFYPITSEYVWVRVLPHLLFNPLSWVLLSQGMEDAYYSSLTQIDGGWEVTGLHFSLTFGLKSDYAEKSFNLLYEVGFGDLDDDDNETFVKLAEGSVPMAVGKSNDIVFENLHGITNKSQPIIYEDVHLVVKLRALYGGVAFDDVRNIIIGIG